MLCSTRRHAYVHVHGTWHMCMHMHTCARALLFHGPLCPLTPFAAPYSHDEPPSRYDYMYTNRPRPQSLHCMYTNRPRAQPLHCMYRHRPRPQPLRIGISLGLGLLTHLGTSRPVLSTRCGDYARVSGGTKAKGLERASSDGLLVVVSACIWSHASLEKSRSNPDCFSCPIVVHLPENECPG